jgi:hypothetical protein
VALVAVTIVAYHFARVRKQASLSE